MDVRLQLDCRLALVSSSVTTKRCQGDSSWRFDSHCKSCHTHTSNIYHALITELSWENQANHNFRLLILWTSF